MTDTAAKPAASKPTGTLTEYVVLGESRTTAGGWNIIARTDARSADAAIRHIAESADTVSTSDSYVAVPARSWRPVTVTVETKTTIRLS